MPAKNRWAGPFAVLAASSLPACPPENTNKPKRSRQLRSAAGCPFRPNREWLSKRESCHRKDDLAETRRRSDAKLLWIGVGAGSLGLLVMAALAILIAVRRPMERQLADTAEPESPPPISAATRQPTGFAPTDAARPLQHSTAKMEGSSLFSLPTAPAKAETTSGKTDGAGIADTLPVTTEHANLEAVNMPAATSRGKPLSQETKLTKNIAML